MNRRTVLLDVLLVVLVFGASQRVFRTSTGPTQLCDSTYSLLAAEKILTAGSADLREHVPVDPGVRRQMHGYDAATDLPYQFVRYVDPRSPDSPAAIYYGYPLGSTVLSLPFSRYYVSKQVSVVRSDGQPDLENEALLQQRIASKVSAAIVVLFYAIARGFCSPFLAALLALGFGLGSPVWSTLSRALWSHTWMVFWLGAALVMLVNRRRAKPWIIGLGLGTALFAMVFTRPHAVLSAGPILLYLAFTDRRTLVFTIAAGAAWSAGYMGVSYSFFGSPTPPSVYEPGTIDGRDVFNRLAGLLVSPSRGLVVYCPYLMVVGALLVAYRRHIRDGGLLIPAGLSCAAYVGLFSMYSGWHAGSSYGPRYFSDLMPWFVLAGAMAVDAMRRADTSRIRKGIEILLLSATFAWGLWVHGRGANSMEAWEWNYLAIAAGPEAAARDWEHPQFLAGITFRVRPDGSVEFHQPK